MNRRANSPEDSRTAARRIALELLARREHSVLELRQKLLWRAFPPADIDAVLERLLAENLLDETRYAESYAHSRADKGYGPLRIDRELRERGLADEIIAPVLAGLASHWRQGLASLHRKKFKGAPPADVGDEMRQMRFLRQRGFSVEQITGLFRDLKEHSSA
jgi:regulatory protein